MCCCAGSPPTVSRCLPCPDPGQRDQRRLRVRTHHLDRRDRCRSGAVCVGNAGLRVPRHTTGKALGLTGCHAVGGGTRGTACWVEIAENLQWRFLFFGLPRALCAPYPTTFTGSAPPTCWGFRLTENANPWRSSRRNARLRAPCLCLMPFWCRILARALPVSFVCSAPTLWHFAMAWWAAHRDGSSSAGPVYAAMAVRAAYGTSAWDVTEGGPCPPSVPACCLAVASTRPSATWPPVSSVWRLRDGASAGGAAAAPPW